MQLECPMECLQVNTTITYRYPGMYVHGHGAPFVYMRITVDAYDAMCDNLGGLECGNCFQILLHYACFDFRRSKRH